MMLSNCTGKCPKLAKYITITDNGHHFTTLKLIRNNFVACNLPPDGRSSFERGLQPTSKEQCRTTTGDRATVAKADRFCNRSSFESLWGEAWFCNIPRDWWERLLENLEQACTQGSSMMDTCLQDRTCLLKKWTRKAASQFWANRDPTDSDQCQSVHPHPPEGLKWLELMGRVSWLAPSQTDPSSHQLYTHKSHNHLVFFSTSWRALNVPETLH